MKEDILRTLYKAYISNVIRKEHMDVPTDQITKAMKDKKKKHAEAIRNEATRGT